MGERICASAVWGEVNWKAPAILSEERHEDAVEHLVKYFAPTKTTYIGAYSGAEFNELGGGGDRPEIADVITAEDILAVSALSVNVPATHALQLLGRGVTKDGLAEAHEWRQKLDHDRPLLISQIPFVDEVPIDAEVVSEVLQRVPTGQELSTVESVDIDSVLRNVDLLWREVRRKNMGPTMVSKLLARKRPELLPVIDSFITKQLNHGNRTDFYFSMWKVMSDKRMDLPEHLRAMRDDALEKTRDERIGRLSELRVFDIVVWREEEQIRKAQSSS